MGTKHDILANQVIDMQSAIVGFREKLAYRNEGELIDELERMIDEALKEGSFPMENGKAIELLKEMTKEENWAIGDTGAMYYMPENIIKKPWEVVNQALALLRQQPPAKCMYCGKITPNPIYGNKVCCLECLNKPPAGEFTAKLINVWNEYLSTSFAILNIPRKRELAGKVNDLIGEACSRLDAAEQEKAELEEWKKAILGKIKRWPIYSTGKWTGDKEGWGYIFELIGLVGRNKNESDLRPTMQT